MARNRSVRLSQTIVPFGVGAIYDYLGESFVACDTTFWKNHGARLELRRLAEKHGVQHFKAAPVQGSSRGGFAPASPGVPYLRFPRWLFCQKCRAMTHWSEGREKPGEEPVCGSCAKRPKLVPMRFVVVCPSGHLDDVPWQLWAHSKPTTQAQRQCQSKNLRFRTLKGQGTGLRSLAVQCESCEAGRSLEDISRPHGFTLRCTGRQPWQKVWTTCGDEVQIVQRGASNVYFARTDSAIDIPPDSSYATYSSLSRRVAATPYFEILRSAPNSPIADSLISQCAAEAECSPEDVRVILAQEVGAVSGGPIGVGGEGETLEAQEWRAFITRQVEQDERDRFITRHVTPLITEQRERAPKAIRLLADLVPQVVLATRLREVRALIGFQRYDQGPTVVRPSLDDGKVSWLPAIEVFGEGIFLRLDEAALRRWESAPAVVAAASSLESRRQGNLLGARLRAGTPRYILLHTLAHLLIRQLSFECGYSASSLRERVYARAPQDGDPMAGILIYTAAGDAEGTLGGLVRQGEPPRLAHTLLSALERAAWCSMDPICRECTSQGFGGLNRAACHACALVAETSCDNANALLDRSMLTGSAAEGVPGFFADALEAALRESSTLGTGA